MTYLLKKLKHYSYGFTAALLIGCAAGLRIVLTALGWPVLNSDEAIMQLMALHIEKNGEHPIFMYGQNYLGSIEAYIGAFLFRLFGPSIFSMRVGTLIFYVGFLVCMYFITSQIYTKALALIVLVLLGLGTQWVLIFQLQTLGYTSLSFLCALLFLISYQLVATEKVWYWKTTLYVLWGIVAGLTIWTHLLAVPYVLVAGLLLLVQWRVFLKYGGWLLLVGLIIGAWPLIYYNLHAAPGADSYHVFLGMSQLGGDIYPTKWYLYAPFVITLPGLLGFGMNCYVTHMPNHLHLVPPQTSTCLVAQEIYGYGYITALFVALLIILAAFWMLRKTPDRHLWILQFTRLLLLTGAGLTLIVFARNPTSIFAGILGVRYLICLLVSLPAVLWPLWVGIDRMQRLPKRGRIPLLLCRLGIIALLCALSLRATLHIFDQVPIAQADQQNSTKLAQKLEQMHITRFFTEYWTCNRLIFQTQEQLICNDTWPNLAHGYDRYAPYRAAILADPNPSFVYAEDSGRIPELENAMQATHTGYNKTLFDGYVIYQPVQRIPDVKLYQ